jgi:RimJ/RimL family protein N-acetyltransferase
MSANYWKTDKIRLRGVEPEDAPAFYEWNLDSEQARALDFVWPPSSMAMVRAWTIEQSIKKLEDDRFFWVIETNQGVAVGAIDTHHCDRRAGTFSYGIAIGSAHRNRGYAAAAIQLVLKYYFEELRYQKATIDIHSFNTASIQLHERLGFTLEGTLRRMGFSQGSYFDVHWYGMTAEEFQARAPQESPA